MDKKQMKHKISDLKGSIFMSCSACMSVLADGLSWANANKHRIITPDKADNIIILSCQVTDLAILNDLRIAEKYKTDYPHAKVFISGCLAERNDIEFTSDIYRLEQMRDNSQPILDKTLVYFEKPFWVPGFKDTDKELSNGNLFRNHYPLRIGKGCMFNCTYCTIKITRGKHEVYKIREQKTKEFLDNDNILLVADCPTENQIKEWCGMSITYNKQFSIRNIEPQIAISCAEHLIKCSKRGLLKIFHSPIQSCNNDVLKDMHRSVEKTHQTIELSRFLKSLGTIIATNIIIDYKDFIQKNDDREYIYSVYDYVSWNPYFDGIFDRKKAEYRFNKYLNA